MNKVMIAGRLGQDPEVRSAGSTPVLNMRIATTERFKDRDDQWKEKVEWHSVVLFGRRGESLSRILHKGDFVVVEGRLQTRSWEDKATGTKRYATEVVANDVELTGKRQGSGERSDDSAPAPSNDYAAPSGGMGDDDIPF